MFNINNKININNEMNQSKTSPPLSPQNKLFSKFMNYSTQAMNVDPQVDLTSSFSESNGSKVQTTIKSTTNLLFNYKTNEQNSLFNSFKSNQSTSELFQLSEPANNFHTIKSTLNSSAQPSSSLVFTFNEPTRLKSTKSIKINSNDESKFIERNDIIEMNTTFSNEPLSHLDKKSLNTNNNPSIFIINSVRTHPYQPASRVYATNENSESLSSSGDSSLNNKNEPINYSNTNGTSNGSPNESNTNQNNSFNDNNNSNKSSKISITKSNQLVFAGRVNSSSSSNAILAHLKSLGPSLRSIFVRPKNCKLIDSATIFKKLSKESLITGATTNSSDDKQQSINNGNKKSFFSRFYDDEEEYQSLFKKSSPNAKSLLTNPLLNIRPKEMCLDASIDDLFKKCENDFDHSNAFKQNYTSMTITPNKYNDTKQALVKTTSTSSSTSSSSFNSNYQSQTVNEKWTCLVCLSKHLLNVNICSVCGSSKPTTNTKFSSNSVISFSKGYSTSSTSSTASILGFKSSFSNEKLQQQNLSNTSVLIANQKDSKSTKYNAIKCWTCVHCKYSNDNLKIVCMNCRNLKTTPQINRKLSEKLDLNEMSPQKRKISENVNAEKIENDETTNAKTSKPNDNQNSNDKKCENCRNTSESTNKQTSDDTKSKEQSIFSTNISNQSKEKDQSTINSNLTETTKSSENSEPISFFKIKPANSEPKWNCNTCLASNPESADKCACCATPKPTKTSTPLSLQTPISTETKKPDEKPTESLSSLFKVNAGSKWTCSTCMVSNDNDKTTCACCCTPKPSDNSSNRNEPSKLLTNNNSSTFTKLVLPESVNKSTSSGIKFGMSASEQSTNGPIKFGTSSFIAAPISTKSETNAQQSQSTFSFPSNPLTIKPKESLTDSLATSPLSSFKTPTDVEFKSPEKTNQSFISFNKPFSSINTTISSFNPNPLTQTTNTTNIPLATNATENKVSESEANTTSTTSSSLFKFGASSVQSPTKIQSSITITKLSTNENTNNNESSKLLSNVSNDSNVLMTPFKFSGSSTTILTPSTASTTPNSFQSPINNQSEQQSQSTTQPQTKPFSLFQSTFAKDVQSNDLLKSNNSSSDLNAKPSFSFSSNNTSTVPNFSFSNTFPTPTPTPTQSTLFTSISNSTTNSTASTSQPSLTSFNTPILQTNKPFGALNSTSTDSLKPNNSFVFNFSSSNQNLLSNTPAATNNTNNNPSETSLNNLLQQTANPISSFNFGSTANNTATSFQSPSTNTQTNQSSIFSNQAQTNNSLFFKPSVPAIGSNSTSTVFNSNNPSNPAAGTSSFSLPFNSNMGFKFNETTNAFNFQSNPAPVTNFTTSVPTSFNFSNTNSQTPGTLFQFGVGGGENNQFGDNNGKRPFRKATRRYR